MGPIESILLILAYLLGSVVLHELAHLIVLADKTKYKEKPIRFGWDRGITVGVEEHYKSLTSKENIDVYFAGIFVGFVPIMVLLLSYNINLYIGILIILSYMVGCKHDVKQIWRINKYEKNTRNNALTND